MKKETKNYLLSFIALGAVLTSCQKDGSVILREDSNQAVKVTIVAEKSTEKRTRSSINGLVFSWSEQDKLSVYNSANSNKEFTLKASNIGNALGSFDGDLAPTSSKEIIYAVYPYSDRNVFTKSDGNVVTCNFTQPTAQVQNHDATTGLLDPESLGEYSYMTGKTAKAEIMTDGSSLSMKLSQVMTLFDFSLLGIPVNTVIYSLVLRSETDVFAKSATVGFTSNGSVPTVAVGAEKGKSIEVKINDGAGVTVGADGKLTIRLAILPQTIADGVKLYVDVEAKTPATSGAKKLFTLENDLTVASKTYLPGVRYPKNYSFSQFITIPDENPTLPSGLFQFDETEEARWFASRGTPIFANTDLTLNSGSQIMIAEEALLDPGTYIFNVKSMTPGAYLQIFYQQGNSECRWHLNGVTGKTDISTTPWVFEPVQRGFNSNQANKVELRTQNINGFIKATWYLNGTLMHDFPYNQVGAFGMSYSGKILVILGSTSGTVVLDSWEYIPN